MQKEIVFSMSGETFTATLDDTHCPRTVGELIRCAPIHSKVTTWGNEIYFPVGFHEENEFATVSLEAGDITYWPPGDMLCIFFGPTPASRNSKPVPASAVTVVGKMRSLDGLKKVVDGQSVEIIIK